MGGAVRVAPGERFTAPMTPVPTVCPPLAAPSQQRRLVTAFPSRGATSSVDGRDRHLAERPLPRVPWEGAARPRRQTHHDTPEWRTGMLRDAGHAPNPYETRPGCEDLYRACGVFAVTTFHRR